MTESPWWYRMRGGIFGLIYFAGFFVGSLIWSPAREYEPFFLWGGAYLGTSGTEIVLGVAVVCTLLCFALRAWGSAYLNADVVWNANAVTDALIVQGPFRYTRSPLYLGNIFMAIGIGALATPCGFGIIVVGSIAFVWLLVQYETGMLRVRYGPLVDAYVRAVPPLLPRPTPASLADSGHVTPSLIQGLRSEIFTACIFVGMAALFFLGMRAFPEIWALWILGWIAQHLVTSRLPANATPPEP